MNLKHGIFKAIILGLIISGPTFSFAADDAATSRAAIGRAPISVSALSQSDAASGRTVRGNAADSAMPGARTTISRAIGNSNSAAANLADLAGTSRTSTNDNVVISRGVMTSAALSQSAEQLRNTSNSNTAVSARTSVQRAGTAAATSDIQNSVGARQSAKGSVNESAPVRRAGVTLRPSTAEFGGRAMIGDSGVMTGSNFKPAQTVSPRTVRAATDIATATDALASIESVNSLTDSCQEQYNDCMDQFCNVVDANQKRCSCSSRLSNYAKVEEGVKSANDQLNEVAQRIRYVGLSADEIRAILNATEAELAMQGQTDNTESRNMLEEIEKLIQNPGTFVSQAGNVSSFDFGEIDFTDTANIADMFNFEIGGTQSFSNMRGTELYNAAKNRCNNILTTCRGGGANSTQISARYDMEVDKDCIAYEQGLQKMNSTVRSNVRSAIGMLEKARLAVLQNQNAYDTKGCIGALDTCMKDEMVCGSNYYKCLDPTKSYIDENGEVILGRDVTKIRDMMTNYNNANITSGNILDWSGTSVTINEAYCTGAGQNDGRCIVKYLMTKIGTDSNTGLCRAVMDKCRRSTYDSNNAYIKSNDVVTNYVQRAMVNIKAAQENIISEYASSCMLDIAACYNQQVSQVNTWSSTASVSSIYNVMTGACRNVALTCAYAVFENDTNLCPVADATKCVQSISEMFYQSLLCPENSSYDNTAPATVKPGFWNGTQVYVNDKCLCNTGYTYYSGACIQCPANSVFDNTVTNTTTVSANGTLEGVPIKGCKCSTGYETLNGSCVSTSAQ